MQGALWLVSGGFIFTSNGVMIRLLSEQIESVQTAFFRAVFSVLLLLPLMLTGRVKPWHCKRMVGHFWRTVDGHHLDGAGLLRRVDAAAGRCHGDRLLPAVVLGRASRR